MEQRTIYVSDDGCQFETAEQCQRYEALAGLIRELSDHRNPVPMALAPHRGHIDALLEVLRRRLPNEEDDSFPELQRLDPLELTHAVDALIYLADSFRKV